MKQPIALRIDPDLLADIRRCAAAENRTLTNFIETVLKARVSAQSTIARTGSKTSPSRPKPRLSALS